MHIGRVHDKTIPTFTGHHKNPKLTVSTRARRMVVLEDHTDHEHGGGVAVATLKRTTRQEVVEEAQVPVQQFHVNGCPNCLKPLKPMNDGYARISIAPPPFCPFCKCPVGMVRTALRVLDKTAASALVPA